MKSIVITGNSIPLTKQLAKKWRGARVEFTDWGGLFVEPVRSRDTFGEALAVMREVGKGVTRQDLRDAIRWARKQRSTRA